VKIDGDHGIALGRHQLGVPASRPAVAETALRSAMDEKCHRQLAGRPGRLDNLAPYLIAICTDKIKALDINRIDLSELAAVDIGQLGYRTILLATVQIGRKLQAVHRVDA
jgi:hypothetical protein